ncbi:MAG: tetratricopeptide repeat protein [Acidobacteria bacterium]|nr:tetratricopeptide repeat protein [Acidobacteriota bacterium]
MTRGEARAQLTDMVSRDEKRLELDQTALLIAAEEYPNLEIKKYLDKLDSFAHQARELDDRNAEPLERIMWLSDLLFNDLGFRGNVENYSDARNSFLNDVIDRRTGIPITLSVIFLEVARRIGLKLFGVGMPGHFIVKYADDDLEILIDPFNGGRLLSEERCREMIEQMYGGTMSFHPSFLDAVTKKQILTRMLLNLKGIYARAMDNHKTLSVIERLLLVDPDAVAEIRDRGLVYFSLERYAQAQEDLEEYLRRAPKSEDAKEIKERIKELRQRQAQLN